jgi:ribonuclease-3
MNWFWLPFRRRSTTNSIPELSSENKSRLIEILGFKPRNFCYYAQAITHSSAIYMKGSEHIVHNERLEYLGDSVLDLVMAEYLYEHHPEKMEGELTRMRSAMVNRGTLNRIADQIGLSNLIIGKFNFNRLPEDVKGNALEALLGAIFLDKGFSKTRKFIRKKLIKAQVFGSVPGSELFDYKSALLIHCQRERVLMTFELLEEHLSPQGNEYTMGVLVDGNLLGKGRATSKKKAQQMAAKMACRHLSITSDLAV